MSSHLSGRCVILIISESERYRQTERERGCTQYIQQCNVILVRDLAVLCIPIISFIHVHTRSVFDLSFSSCAAHCVSSSVEGSLDTTCGTEIQLFRQTNLMFQLCVSPLFNSKFLGHEFLHQSEGAQISLGLVQE